MEYCPMVILQYLHLNQLKVQRFLWVWNNYKARQMGNKGKGAV